jgi:hypothetical protein
VPEELSQKTQTTRNTCRSRGVFGERGKNRAADPIDAGKVDGMSDVRRTRPLDDAAVASLRALIGEHGSRRLAGMLGVPRETLERAALGVQILAGNRRIISDGIARILAGVSTEGQP